MIHLLQTRSFWSSVVILLACAPFYPAFSQNPGTTFSSLIESVGDVRSGLNEEAEDSTSSDDFTSTASEYFYTEVEPVIQGHCLVCHQASRVAQKQGARLLYSNDNLTNEQATYKFVSLEGVGSDWLLRKIIGELNHGGGAVLTVGGDGYNAFAEYLTLATGANIPEEEVSKAAFWDNTGLESRERTLRRAGLLLAGKIPTQIMINRASQSDEALREEVLKMMSGEGFHDFLVNGANDRLLTDGLNAGIAFEFDLQSRFPAFTSWASQFPNERPEGTSHIAKPFLARAEAEEAFRWAVIREPMELIAHIVMNDKSYKQVMTANYTMVNLVSAKAYRSNTEFDGVFPDELGFFEYPQLNVFKPGKNHGHVPWDHQLIYDWETWSHKGFGNYQEWPHAGILSTPAFMLRYPSTDTNRNRARARWTYFHFLGVDIEKSAPRTTDAEALADVNNPTMNNPACTVCHERMDPVAGAFQSFGDNGHYRETYGGTDSLTPSYKQTSAYQLGDTWYRDMRNPGFEGETAPNHKDSIQWLSRQIVNDPRFSTATVKFWWPSIFGEEALSHPEDPSSPNYQSELLAYNAQQSLIAALASRFVESDFRAKELFADMILSRWYRTGSVDPGIPDIRQRALESVGAGRLLTPAELDRKNHAVLGRTWGESHWTYPWYFERFTNFSGGGQQHRYDTYYGGIDGAAVTDRNREMTALMSNVAYKMSVDLSCQVVLEEFSKPRDQRTLFKEVEKNTHPLILATNSHELVPSANSSSNDPEFYTHRMEFSAGGGGVELRFTDMPNDCIRDGDKRINGLWVEWCSNLGLKNLDIYENGRRVISIAGNELADLPGFKSATKYDDETGKAVPRGHTRGDYWLAATGAWFSIELNLPAGDYEASYNLVTHTSKGHPQPTVLATVHAKSIDYYPQTTNAKLVSKQIDLVFKRGTGEKLDPSSKQQLLDAMIKYSSDVSGENFHGSCNENDLWDFSEMSNEERDLFLRQISVDPEGMMHAWTLIVHSMLTSYAYLYD